MNLMPHQVQGVAFLADRSTAMLYDEAGTGKTATVIRAAQQRGFRRILVLCPAGVRRAWEREISLWWQDTPPQVSVVEGADGPYLNGSGDGWTIASHASLSTQSSAQALWTGAGGAWDLLVVDESSEFRRFEAKRTANLLGDNGLWTFATAVWLLDGDPVVNSSMDLYPALYGPVRRQMGMPPPAWEFGLAYASWIPDRNGYRAIGVRNETDLSLRLKPFVLRRTLASAGITLPALDIQRHTVPLSDSAMAAASAALVKWQTMGNQVRLAQMLDNGDDVRDGDISRARHILGVAKVPAVAAHVLNLRAAGNLPVVVFFQHTAVRDGLLKALVVERLRCGYIDGTISKKTEYGAVIDLFTQGGLDVLLVQIQSGGRGLTLTRANRVVIAEMPWTAVALWQAVKRVHRITQTRPVVADIIVADHWLDQSMAATVRRKDAAGPPAPILPT